MSSPQGSSPATGASSTANPGTIPPNIPSRQLPPLRTVLGPQLDLPTPSSARSPYSSRDRDSEDPWQPRPPTSSGSDTSPGSSSALPHLRGRDSVTSMMDNPPLFDLPHSSHSTAPASPIRQLATPTNPPADPSGAFPPSFDPSCPFPPVQLPALFSPSNPPHRPHAFHSPPPSQPFTPNLQSEQPSPPHSAPPSSWHILSPSPSGELITAPPIIRNRRPRGAPTTASGSSSTSGPSGTKGPRMQVQRRHVCEICKKKFNRPSSLKTHQSVHTGSRPFACSYRGCTKRFSVASNMRRHLRRHEQGRDHAEQPSPESTQDHELLPDTLGSSEGSGSVSGEGDGSGDGEMDVDGLMEEDLHIAGATATSRPSGLLSSHASSPGPPPGNSGGGTSRGSEETRRGASTATPESGPVRRHLRSGPRYASR